jgi:hypothetical protein
MRIIIYTPTRKIACEYIYTLWSLLYLHANTAYQVLTGTGEDEAPKLINIKRVPMQIITPDVATTQLAKRIASLLEANPSCDAAHPAGFLAELVQEVAQDNDLTTEDAIAHIAQKGTDWMGGEGRIGLNVYRLADGSLRVEWKRDDSTWVALGQLLEAIENDNERPHWFDSDWIENAAE